MSAYRQVKNTQTGKIVLARAKWCASAFCRFRGLQLRGTNARDAGLIFVNSSESRSESAIHMFFVFMNIAVVWLDSAGKIVDKTLAKPWRPYYAPQSKARYFIEAHPDILAMVEIGDVLTFEDVP